jgi:hypothetical protein
LTPSVVTPSATTQQRPFQLDAVEHQRGQTNIGQRAAHERLEALAGPADELAADRRLRSRALRVEDILTDELSRAREAARRDARQHLLEHNLRQRIAIGEVRVGRQRDLTAAVGGPHPRTLDGHPTGAERHAPGLMAVSDRDAVGVVTALRTDDVIDLRGHQLAQHPESDADAERQQPLLGRAGQLAQRVLHALRQHVELRLADRVGVLLYGPHGGSPRLDGLIRTRHAASGNGRGDGGPPPQVLRATGQPH